MSGSSPLSRPRSASQTTSIAAPSLRPDALPAVTVPWNAGRKSRQRLGGRLRARMFVLLQLVHRHQLVAKMSSRLSRAATLLAPRRKTILRLARNPESFRQPLRRHAQVFAAERIRQPSRNTESTSTPSPSL